MATSVAETKRLVCLEIATPAKVWHRVLYTDEPAVQADLEFYYRTLLGFQDATIRITTETVPEDFNTALLGIADVAPSSWPASDLETDPDDCEKRAKYMEYIQRLCEMERSRASLRLFMRGPTTPVPELATPPQSIASSVTQDEIYTTRRHRMKRAWVHEVLKSINNEIYGDDAYAIVACEMGEEPFGWIFTPTMRGGRSAIGSRIILNKEVGKKWQELLGTTYYPDLVVSSRISTASWAFQHALSNQLIENTTRWYLASQDVEMVEEISPFMADADKDLASLFLSFRRIKISERLLSESAGTDRVAQVYKILSAIENTLLATANTDASIHPIDHDSFLKYAHYTLRSFNIPREIYGSMEGISQIVWRWVRGRMGFAACIPPLVQSWAEMWTLLMGEGAPTATRVNLFLATLDSYDIVQAALMSQMDKLAISQEWIRVYIETQLMADPDSKIRSTVLYEQVQTWCSKFLPADVFGNQFSPFYIGPILTRRGMVVRKEKSGRFMGGYKFKNFIGDPIPFAVQKKGWGGGVGQTMADAKKQRRAAAAKAEAEEEEEDEEEDAEEAEAATAATESVMDRFGSRDLPAAVTQVAERTVLINETITTPVGVEKNHVVISKVKTEKKTRTTVAGSRTKKSTAATTASNTKPPATTVEQFFVSSTVTTNSASADSDEEEDAGVINLGHV